MQYLQLDASVWKTWEELLRKDGITAIAANFTLDDECGSAEEHALELNQIVENFKNKTGAERINIVAHSKGGLDARVYLANGLSNDDIAFNNDRNTEYRFAPNKPK